MTTNSQLSTTEPKKRGKEKHMNNLSKQLEQEQIYKNRDHMEGYQWGGVREEGGGKVQGRRGIISRHKLNRER